MTIADYRDDLLKFVSKMDGNIKSCILASAGRLLDGRTHDEFPETSR